MKHEKPSGKQKDPNEDYMRFRTCKNQCFACNECGYYWGPAHKLAGKPVDWYHHD